MKLIIASSEISSDMLYATGFFAPDPFVYFAVDDESYAVVTDLEYDRAKNNMKQNINVLNFNDILSSKETGEITISETVIEIINMFRPSEINVPWYFPIKYAKEIEKLNIPLFYNEAPFFPERSQKTKKEISEIQKGLEIAESAMQHVFNILSDAQVDNSNFLLWNGEKLSSEILKTEIQKHCISLGATAAHTIAASGKQGMHPHDEGNGPISANNPIVLDIFPRLNRSGYWGDLSRTVLKGKASKYISKAFYAVKEARDTAEFLIKPGVKASDIHSAASEILQKNDFENINGKDGSNYGFIHGLGHGVGLDIHEAPRLSPGNNSCLNKGNILTVEPGLYFPDLGGIRLEDMVLVTENGAECLNKIDTFLEID